MFTEITFFGLSMTVGTALLILAAGLCTILAYADYFRKAVDGVTRPNPWSWIIWGITTTAEAFTYTAVSEDWLQSSIFYVSAICCLVVTMIVFASWRLSKPKWPDLVEWACILATAAAMYVWFAHHDSWHAHLIMVIAIPISFVPAWIEAWKKPFQERARAWILWSIGDLLTLILILTRFDGSNRELLYIIVELVCHFGMLVLVIERQCDQSRKAPRPARRYGVITLDKTSR